MQSNLITLVSNYSENPVGKTDIFEEENKLSEFEKLEFLIQCKFFESSNGTVI